MKVKIEHRIGIQAPAEAIWEVLSDIERWADWNPLYPKAEGKLRIGAPLRLELALPERKPQTIRPVVIDWIPNEQIHWKLSALAGLVRATRYLEIEKLTETGCIFANGELFDGPLASPVVRSLRGPVRRGFAAMSEAVKARSEAAWRGWPPAGSAADLDEGREAAAQNHDRRDAIGMRRPLDPD
jgi:hypothetical protein